MPRFKYVVALVFALMLFACHKAKARDLYIDANLASYHFCKCEAVNNQHNYGAGLTYTYAEGREVKIGEYKNSFSNTSGYVVNNFFWSYSQHIHYGIAVGVVSGYNPSEVNFLFVGNKLSIAVVPNITLKYNRFRTSLELIGPALGLQMQYRVH